MIYIFHNMTTDKLWFCGLDISKYKTGIALGKENVILPFKIVATEVLIKEINTIKNVYGFLKFVIGIPNKKYNNFKFIKDFTHKYRNFLKPFFFQNEDYTSSFAKDEKNIIHDDISACIILEDFLRKNHGV